MILFIKTSLEKILAICSMQIREWPWKKVIRHTLCQMQTLWSSCFNDVVVYERCLQHLYNMKQWLHLLQFMYRDSSEWFSARLSCFWCSDTIPMRTPDLQPVRFICWMGHPFCTCCMIPPLLEKNSIELLMEDVDIVKIFPWKYT